MRDNTKIVLTPKQEAWLIKHFKHTKNVECAERLGISESTLHRFARQLGLRKTPQFRRKTQLNAAEKARAANRRNGWPPKGYRIPRSEEFQIKPGERMKDRIGEERWRAAREKAHETWKKTWKHEHARMVFGVPRKTKFRVVQQPRQKVLDRHYLKKRGYVIDEENRIAYWTKDTLRATRLEARPKRYYQFEKHPSL